MTDVPFATETERDEAPPEGVAAQPNNSPQALDGGWYYDASIKKCNTPPPVGATELRPEEPGSDQTLCEWVQGSLNRINGEAMAVDGVYGHTTVSAVRRWQRLIGITNDGIVGPRTIESIETHVDGKPSA